MQHAVGIAVVCLVVFISQGKITEANDNNIPGLVNDFVIQTSVNVPKVKDDGHPINDAQRVQQWLLQVAQQFVAPQPIFDGLYECNVKEVDLKKIQLAILLTRGEIKFDENGREFQRLQKAGTKAKAKSQILKLLFSLGARLSAIIGGGKSEITNPLKAFLKAYECIGEENNDDNVYNYQIDPIKENGQMKFSGVVFGKQINHYAEENFAFLRRFTKFNEDEVELGPEEVLDLADYLHYMFLNKYIEEEWKRVKPINAFGEPHLTELGLKVEELDQDPVRYRRVAQQLVKNLKGWTKGDLKNYSTKSEPVPLELRELCAIGTFGRNLLRRVASYSLLEEYQRELGLNEMAYNLKNKLEFFEDFAQNNCEKMMGNAEQRKRYFQQEGYFLFEDAIRLDFNIWKAIIGSIDQISREMEMKEKQKKKKEELIIYVKSKEFEKAMKIIGTKFEAEKYGLNLSIEDDPGMKKREKIKKTLKKLIVDPYHKEVETFLKNLENVKGHCHAEIVEFEKEIPMKKYIKAMNAKLKENFGQFFGLVMKAIGQKYGAKAEKKKMMIYTLENAKIFLEELAKLTTQKFGPNCEKRKGEGIKVNKYRRKCSEKAPAFVGILVDLLGPESKSQIEQIEHQLYNVEEEVNYLRRRNPNMDDVTRIIDAQMSLLLYSFAARLEAMVHEKKEMAKKSEKESSNKSAVKKLGIIAENASQLSTFLTVSECVYLPEWANLDFCISPYYLEMVKLAEMSRGVEIREEMTDEYKEWASRIGQEGYQLLNGLNNMRFSIYQTLVLLVKLRDVARENRFLSSELKKPELVTRMVDQVANAFQVMKIKNPIHGKSGVSGHITQCEYAKLAERIWAKVGKEMAKNGNNIRPIEDHMHYWDNEVQKELKQAKVDSCGILEGELNSKDKVSLMESYVRYDLVIHFNLNPWKELYDRIDDLLFGWEKDIINSKNNVLVHGNEAELMKKLSDYGKGGFNGQRMTKIEELAPKDWPLKLGLEMEKMFEIIKEAKEKKEIYERVEKKWRDIDEPDAERKRNVWISEREERAKENEREVMAKEKEIGAVRKELDRLRKSVGQEEAKGAKMDGQKRGGAAKNREILVKIRELQKLEAELEEVGEQGRLLVRKSERGMEQKIGQKSKQKQTHDQLNEKRELVNKTEILKEEMVGFQKKIEEVFKKEGATDLVENSENNEVEIDGEHLGKAFDRIEERSTQIMKELGKEFDALSKVGKIEELGKTEDEMLKSHAELMKELSKLKGKKPLNYGERKAKIEKNLANAKKDLEKSYNLLRSRVEQFRQTLENAKVYLENKANEWERNGKHGKQ